jgi:acetyl esterase/lipase
MREESVLPAVHTYGSDPEQHAELWLPDDGDWLPVVVLIHGGFCRARYNLDRMRPLAADLTGRGMAVWNLEYRRVGQSGGGWPGTLNDVATGIQALKNLDAPLDLGRVALVGHSAGGHLALWAAGAGDGMPGAPRREVAPIAAVSLAGVADLRAGVADNLSNGAVADFLGATPDEAPDRYLAASPIERLPLGIPQLLVHGDADENVPVSQSRGYVAAATAAGDDVELLELPGADHFVVVDPSSGAWEATASWLARRLRV